MTTLITHRFPIEDAVEAFRLAQDNPRACSASWLSPRPNRASAGAAEVWHWAESQNRPTFETTLRLPARMAGALVRHAAWCRPGYGPAMLGLALAPS